MNHEERFVLYIIRKAAIEDSPLLVPLRLEVLRKANNLPEDTPLKDIEKNTLVYLRENFGSQATFLAFDGNDLLGCGSVSFYKIFPTCDCPGGIKAYIMNMYTHEIYRKRGIASALLVKLIEEARRFGADIIALETTDMGRPLYAKHGFVSAKNEMYLDE